MSFFQLRSPKIQNPLATPDVVGGVVNASIAQVAATITAADGGGTTVSATAIVNANIAQLAATVTATGGIQVVTSANFATVAQLAATVTATGGTQVVATVRNASITQLAATITASGGTQAIAAHTNTLQNNLVDYWKLDDASGTTAIDSVGGNNGTWQGTLGSQWGTGKLNGDGVFNGTDNYISVGDVASLSFGTGNFTLSAWVKTTASARQTIVGKYQYTGTSVESGYYIDMLAGGNLRAVYETTNANLRNSDSSVTINDGNWHLVVAVRPSTTGDPLIYVDGTLDSGSTHAFDAGTPGNIDNSISFGIGQSIVPSLSITNWTGQLDEVGIWNRDLTSAEVTSLYNSGVGQQYPFGASAVNATVAQLAATVTATGGTQLAQTNGLIAQAAATITASGGTQTIATVNNVSITQLAATVTATGGTQVVATVRLVSIAQLAATVTATGGTQTIATVRNATIAQLAATVTASGGTQVIATINNVSITQAAATVTAAGGTQSIGSIINAAISQLAATVTATGGTQTVAAKINASVTQLAASVTASGGTQVVSASAITSASIVQTAAQILATGGTQTLTQLVNIVIAQRAANLTASGGIQAVVATIQYVQADNLSVVAPPDVSLTANDITTAINITSIPDDSIRIVTPTDVSLRVVAAAAPELTALAP